MKGLADGLPLGSRLHLADGHLIAVPPGQPLSEVAMPDGCAAPRVDIDWAVDVAGVSVAFDPVRRQGLVLASDGAASIWTNGAVTIVLPPRGDGPDLGVAQQVVVSGSAILAADAEAIWRYDPGPRTWARAPLTLPRGVGAVREVDVVPGGEGRASVTVWTTAGASLGGQWQDGQPSVLLSPMRGVRLATIKVPPRDIVAASERDNVRAIGTAAQVQLTGEGAGRASGLIDPPCGAGFDPVPRAIGGLTAFAAPMPDGMAARLVFLPSGTDLDAVRGSLADVGFDYTVGSDRGWGIADDGSALWRVDAAGAVSRCDIVAGGSAAAGCRTGLALPLAIAAESIGLVFQANGSTYAVVDGALAAFDATWRDRVDLTGPRPGPDALAFAFSTMALLWDGPGAALWQIDGNVARPILPQADLLHVRGPDLLANTPGGLYWSRRSAMCVPRPTPPACRCGPPRTTGRRAATSPGSTRPVGP